MSTTGSANGAGIWRQKSAGVSPGAVQLRYYLALGAGIDDYYAISHAAYRAGFYILCRQERRSTIAVRRRSALYEIEIG